MVFTKTKVMVLMWKAKQKWQKIGWQLPPLGAAWCLLGDVRSGDSYLLGSRDAGNRMVVQRPGKGGDARESMPQM